MKEFMVCAWHMVESIIAKSFTNYVMNDCLKLKRLNFEHELKINDLMVVHAIHEGLTYNTIQNDKNVIR